MCRWLERSKNFSVQAMWNKKDKLCRIKQKPTSMAGFAISSSRNAPSWSGASRSLKVKRPKKSLDHRFHSFRYICLYPTPLKLFTNTCHKTKRHWLCYMINVIYYY